MKIMPFKCLVIVLIAVQMILPCIIIAQVPVSDNDKVMKTDEKKPVEDKKLTDDKKSEERTTADENKLTDEKKQGGDKKSSAGTGEIVITATRTPRKIGAVPAGVSVITKEDIDKMPIQYADEALKNTTGVFLKRAKLSDSTVSVGMRGLYSGTYCLVMLDGMPLNDGYSSAIQFPHISKESIERIEVVRGPYSSLYGQNAMGGVVNIITRSPQQQEIKAKISYGSYNTWAGHAHYDDLYVFNNSFIESIGVSFAGDLKSSDGYRNQFYQVGTTTTGTGTPVTGWEKTTDVTGTKTQYKIGDTGNNTWNQEGFNGKMYLNFSADTNLLFTYSYTKYAYGYDNARSYLKDSNGNPVTSGIIQITDGGSSSLYKTSTYSFTAGDSEDTRQVLFSKFTSKFKDMMFMLNAGYNGCKTWYTTPAGTSGSGLNTMTGGLGKRNTTDPKDTIFMETQLDIPFAIPMLQKSWITVGASHRQDKANGEEYYVKDWNDSSSDNIAKISSMSGKQECDALFTQVQIGVLKSLNVFAGLRYDRWKNYDGSTLLNTYSSSIPPFVTPTTDYREFSTSTASKISPRGSAVFTPKFGVGNIWSFGSVWASCGTGFNPPNLYKLYKLWSSAGTTYQPNPDLKPETCISWEVGTDQKFLYDRIKVSFIYFKTTIDNLVFLKSLSTTQKQYMNADQGKVSGYETEIRINILAWLELFGNYTHQSTEITKNDADTSLVGKKFQMAPDDMFNVGLMAKTKRVGGSISWRYTGKVYSSSDNSDTATDVYGAYDKVMLLDAKLCYYATEKCTVSLSANNILNREYYVYYKAQGRTFNLEVESSL